ncbi:phosphoribosylglycinamide formyltransferase-1 [Oceanotoga teriensis]|uniref:phosphoribosylglycinamide formyltransferase 1 n=1 Tax=Oceanotoga teriensis TaxID=515440 RepID=A0AA45HJE9_9BACT|nr:formyltransferase family protein [Oceanotoga teriensis]PWJ95855.1 phosphoribosylglycinamide formyltransferase-1 [Oceanotoga teriensis]
MNYCFYVSGKASRLYKIIKYANKNFIKKIKFVYSDSKDNRYLKEILEDKSILYILKDFYELEKPDRNLKNSDNLLRLMKKNKIDYCFSFGDHILKGKILKEYKNKIINFHPSILPNYPGRNAIDKAINDNASILGNTAHFIDEGIDTGPIILQSVISSEAFYKNGYDFILDLQIEMLFNLDKLLENKKIKVEGNKVKIINADITKYFILPDIKD